VRMEATSSRGSPWLRPKRAAEGSLARVEGRVAALGSTARPRGTGMREGRNCSTLRPRASFCAPNWLRLTP
jgi:hypothetical protein